MIALSLAEVAAAVDGVLADVPDPAARVTGSVAIDSRAVTAGGLFAALPGERVDGHDFAAAALEHGAVAVLAARAVGVPAVVVDDVVAALGRLAGVVLRSLPEVTVVGVTGSAGKTTTKDLLAALIAPLGPTVAPPESFNNEIGHPFTVLRADSSTRYLVLEYSARGIGHIAALCRVAPPRIAAVLNVGTAHVGEFGSRAAIATAKGELIEALPPAADGGVAVLSADDPLVAAMAPRTPARVVTYGVAAAADVRAEDVTVDGSGRAAYTLRTAAGSAAVALRLVGAHQVGNSLAAAAIALELGVPLDTVAGTLSAAEPASKWRMAVTERADGVTVINDAYNANPDSAASALRTLATIAAGRRPIVVLGEMAELGAVAADEHATVGRLAAELGVARLVAIGPAAAPAAAAAGPAGVAVADVDAAVALLANEVRPADVVLVKGSRVAALERVAAALLAGNGEDGHAAPATAPADPKPAAAPADPKPADPDGDRDR